MHYTYRSEYVRCGRGCRGCPHGPYWYAYWREGRRLRKRYIGKVDPREGSAGDGQAVDVRDRIFARATASEQLACQILEVPYPPMYDECRSAYFRAVKTHHPDRGGDTREFQLREAAWSFLKGTHGWR